MESLTEEIEEMKKEGELLLSMDGNAKIGLLNEEISRNGKLLLSVFENTGLHVMNKSTKCRGKITRINTNNANEYSAIDFILGNEHINQWISEIHIDEEGLSKIKGKKETDHNTIIIKIKIQSIDKTRILKKSIWNLRASAEKWTEYENELKANRQKATAVLLDKNKPLEQRYKKWLNEIEKSARKTIGKTTIKEGSHAKVSNTIKKMRDEKKDQKKIIQHTINANERSEAIKKYKEIQENIRTHIIHEKSIKIQGKLEKILQDKSRNSFWKEKKLMTRNPALESLIIKNDQGKRIYEPSRIKEQTAKYYENLYKMKPYTTHPHHHEVKEKIQLYSTDMKYDHLDYNQPPTEIEIHNIIAGKSNNKSSTDIKNEMLKKPGTTMSKFIHPLISTIWEEESIPTTWNIGHITSIYKGKGDSENLTNHRGITTSSSIGTIMDTLLDTRIERQVPFTQAQGGGKRGASTCDHLFLIRAMIDISIKQKRPTYLTFYDVSKAYDHADNEDMLITIWEKGLRGKTWRILKNLSMELKAVIKTRFGPTRKIDMEIGGRQGSSLTGRLFAKMMDMLGEELELTDKGFKLSELLKIAVLLWVDDVVSCVDGKDNQEDMLRTVDEFAIKHKMKWGGHKCNVMRVGKHKEPEKEWKLGELTIHETKSYTYLGDTLTNDGKNAKNIETRGNKIKASTITINTIASSEVLKKIETGVLLELHNKVNIPSLLMNAESWNLNIGEKTEIEKIEITALKSLFDLPIHTPTPAIYFAFGTLYTDIQIDIKRLTFLHKLVTRANTHWTQKALTILVDQDIGWAKSIKETLKSYNLPTEFHTIKNTSRIEWKRQISTEAEKRHRERLHKECYKEKNGEQTIKMKTAPIIKHIAQHTYSRKPSKELLECSKQETKTIMIARFKMLECGENFKGSMKEICNICKVIDDENHRLNHCKNFKEVNFYDYIDKVEFEYINSDDITVLREIIPKIEKVWNTRTAHGTMNC